jgi:hypothetical protein
VNAEHPLLSRYLALNESFGAPFVFSLTKRGFYSEANNLLNAAMYGLQKKRQLIVDESRSDIADWSKFFASRLPTTSNLSTAGVSKDWMITSAGHPNFVRIRRFAERRHRLHLPVYIPDLGIFGRVLHVKKVLAAMLTRPHREIRLPASLAPEFAAFHIRRGDKTNGYQVGQKLIIEGDSVPPQAYLTMLADKAPALKSIFVMTDDFSVVGELSELARGYEVVSLCQPHQRGYSQNRFSTLSTVEKANDLNGLITETQIAAASSIFIGGYKSNVARFIPLWHSNPHRCFSIDGAKRWTPG